MTMALVPSSTAAYILQSTKCVDIQSESACKPAVMQVKEKVYPLLDALLKRVTGATRTHIFDHTLRNGRIK